MREQFAKSLRCSVCGGELSCIAYKTLGETEIIDGVLKCARDHAYIIYRGVPQMQLNGGAASDFVDAYTERLAKDDPALLTDRQAGEKFSFSFQWNAHPFGETTWELDLSTRVDIFCRYFGIQRSEFSKYRILDAGCGNGTLSAQLAIDGLTVVAMDYSESPIRAYQNRLLGCRVGNSTLQRLDYLRGDVRNPPFDHEVFDIVYADGVLHHTADTKQAFMSLAPRVKVGGKYLVWL